MQPEFADEIDEDFTDMDPKGGGPARKGCIFSRKNPAGKGFACAIYPTRPNICREFKCYRMIIHDLLSGETRGKVIGINELRTHDEILISIWNEKIAHLPHPFREKHGTAVSGGNAVHGHDSHIHAHLHDLEHADDTEWVSEVLTILAAHGYHGDPVEE